MIETQLALSICACLLHTVGFWALWNVKQSNPYMATQRMYLLNLSVAENFHSFFLGGYYLMTMLNIHDWARDSFICAGGGAFLWYLSVIIMLTIDRFLTVYLNMRYLSVWNVKKTKIVLIICFTVAFVTNVFFLIYIQTFEKSLEIFALYLWFPVDNGFIIIACICYAYIFRMVVNRQKRRVKAEGKDRSRTISTSDLSTTTVISLNNSSPSPLPEKSYHRKAIRSPKKTLLIPFLLITTFILFIAFPDNTYFCYFVLKKAPPKELDTLFFIFYPTGIMSDAIIYVLAARDVRQFLFKKLLCK